MRARLTGKAAYCRQRAAACAIRAKRAANTQDRRSLLEMANHWLELANSYAFAEQVSGFIEWNSQRLQPPEAA